MRVLNPSPGELTDRLTILQLKIPAAKEVGKPTEHLQEEYEQIAEALNLWAPRCRSREDTELLTTRLANTNRLLWLREDEVRWLPEPEPLPSTAEQAENIMRLALVAKLIARLNDDRAERIAGLNALYGVEAQEPKIFGA
jgi:hypothetical protein